MNLVQKIKEKFNNDWFKAGLILIIWIFLSSCVSSVLYDAFMHFIYSITRNTIINPVKYFDKVKIIAETIIIPLSFWFVYNCYKYVERKIK